jgi:hypothetical protein
MKACILIILLSITAQSLHAQMGDSISYPIDKYAYSLSLNKILINATKLTYDSVEVNVYHYNNLFITDSYFLKSYSILNVEYVLRNEKLILIKIKEQSPRFKELYCYNYYYFSDEKIYKRRSFANRLMCTPITFGKNNYGYNEDFTDDFLRNFVLDQWVRIRM